MFYVYLLTFGNGTYYYGSSVNPEMRFIQHKHICCVAKKKHNPRMANIWNKHGQPKMEIVGTYQTEKDMIDAEQFYINVSIEDKDNLNVNPIASIPPSQKGKVFSVEHKLNLSKSLKGRPRPNDAGTPRKPILVWNEIEQKVFCSLLEASRKMNIPKSTLHNRTLSNGSGYDGWFVRYLTNDEITLNNEE